MKKKSRIYAVNSQNENQAATNLLIKLVDGTHMLKTFQDGACLVDDILYNQPPELIILNHQPPNPDAISILNTLKTMPELKAIPIVVWSSSATREDIQASYQAGANCFIELPDNSNEIVSKIELVYHYWFEVVILPKSTIFDNFL